MQDLVKLRLPTYLQGGRGWFVSGGKMLIDKAIDSARVLFR